MVLVGYLTIFFGSFTKYEPIALIVGTLLVVAGYFNFFRELLCDIGKRLS